MNPFLLVNQCYNRLPEHLKNKPWEVTEHGRKVLQTEDELNAYIAAYGEMHIVKCRAALQNFPFEDLDNYSYEIFDWGCGQGIATLVLLDMLYERKKLSNLKCIYLIEPSVDALNRATEWVRQNAGPGVEIKPIESYIPNDINALMSNVVCASRISINLFSNILDVRGLSLSWLANKTASLADVNYMICVGPMFIQNTNTRIKDFCNYFKPTEYFSKIDSFPYSYTTRTHHPFGCETRCFVHNKSQLLNSQYQEQATSEINFDPYDYSIKLLSNQIDDNILKFYIKLRKANDWGFDVFFRPMINCDAVDFVLAGKEKGIILINVCENIEDLEDAYNRIETIKNNIFDLHLKSIKVDSIIQSSIYNCIKIGLIFPNNSDVEIENKIKELNVQKNSNSKSQKDYYKYLLRFTNATNLKECLSSIKSWGFKNEYYDELVKLISSDWHSYKDGDFNIKLTRKQDELVRNEEKRLKVKGVSGCGKTQVVANRAVAQLLRTGDRVLIITFNISLIQYIRRRINQVPADFSPNMFEIINYHQFFKSKANQYVQRKINLDDYDNLNYFTLCRGRIEKYKSIIIDEVQDFKESWLQLIIQNFLTDDGSVSLFGDGEQNIYYRELEQGTQMPPINNCGFRRGSWSRINERISLRIQNPQIAELSSKFANCFLGNNTELHIQNEFAFEEYYIKYWKIDEKTTADVLAGNIRWIVSEYKLDNRDVVVLGRSVMLLREIEDAYIKGSGLKTMTTFETKDQYNKVEKSNSKYKRRDIEGIRRVAKTHFTTDCECIKMSTIHSFKGWESKTVILILQSKNMQDVELFDDFKVEDKDNSALIYTALTRAKCNLFILNLNNLYYHEFFAKNINK